MQDHRSHIFLHGKSSTLLINTAKGDTPAIFYWGSKLDTTKSDDNAADDLKRLRTRQGVQGGAFIEIPASLSCELGTGYLGPTGLEVHREKGGWAPLLNVTSVQERPEGTSITCDDNANGLRVIYKFLANPDNDVIRIQTSFLNTGKDTLHVDWAAALSFRVPPELSEVLSFSGRWAGEFQTNRAPLRQGGFLTENRRGRTSHDRFPGLILCAQGTSEQEGPCLGIHLGWSGNHHMRIETLADGRNILQAGEYFMPGELSIAAGESYDTPPLFASYSPNGLSDMSASFHDYYRSNLADERLSGKVRPIHYNTWEGIYFDHSPEVLKQLADAAADIGAERFVLDDGWFKARRNDESGLGDWVVDKEVYPNGLQPIIDYVNKKGLEFGLWVEPEMVNEDSDFFRNNPDWILAAPPSPHVPFRHQFVIDLTRPEAAENIFNQIDSILNEYPDITYLKWDMNRDLNHPGGHSGLPAVHGQTQAVYKLIDRLRAKHTHIEIESCSSGGARTDYGILERTDRIWTSDSNDAIDRQWIQRGASYFFPSEVIGAHVGPRTCHITNRVLSMELRAATAMFGHMGVEADLLDMSDNDKNILKDAFALHKKHRELIHSGKLVRIDAPAGCNAFGVLSSDKQHALYSYAQLDTLREALPGILKFPELDPTTRYHLKLIWPTQIITPPPHRLETSGLMSEGYEASGEILMKAGLQLPLMTPETCLIFEATAI